MFTCGPAFFAAGTSYGPTDNPYYVEVTIPSGKVASNLTDFPVMIDMANLPSSFWSHVTTSGSEIRVKSAGGASSLPFDVARFDKGTSTGWMFVKVPTVAAASSTVIRIYYGASALSALAVTDTYGRNAVWTDYHRVTVFSQPGVDRSGHGSGAYTYLEPGHRLTTAALHSFTLSAGNELQGIEWDGTYYYVVTVKDLYKYDSSWTLIASAANTYTNVSGANHQGDIVKVGSLLYVPTDNWNGSTGSGDRIAVYNASDLSYVTQYDVSTTPGRAIAGLAYNSADGYLWGCDFVDGTTLMRFTTSGVYVDAITLSVAMSQLQGITFLNGYCYASDNSGKVWEIATDGTVRRLCLNPSSTVGEGLTPNGSTLIVARGGTSQLVQTATFDSPISGAITDWLNLNSATSAGHARFMGITKFTQWSVGAHVNMSVKGANRGLVSYYDQTGVSNSTRETLAYHSATDRFGLWNSTDVWLDSTTSPVVSTTYRLNATHDGTTARKFYVNGTGFTDNTVAQRPSGTGDALFVGASDAAGTEASAASYNFAYIRSGILSADWIAAEASNWVTPSGFYTVGTEQAA
jgi:hypothetical protein